MFNTINWKALRTEKFSPEQIEKGVCSFGNMKKALSKEELKEFARYASKGDKIDLKTGIAKLIGEYIDNCGVSISNRTVYYDAAQALLELFIYTDDPLVREIVGDDVDIEDTEVYLVEVMPLFNPDYTEALDKYDITSLEIEEYFRIAYNEAANVLTDELTRIALCYGVWIMFKTQYLGH